MTKSLVSLPPETSPEVLCATDILLQKSLKAMPGLVFIIDGKGRLQAWNQNLEQFIGGEKSTLKDMNLLDLLDPEDRRNSRKKARILLRSDQTESIEIRLNGSQKSRTLDYLVHCNRVVVGDKNFIIGIALDHSARKMIEKELSIVRRMLLERNENLRVINQLYDRLQGYRETASILQATLETLRSYSRVEIFGIFLYNAQTRQLDLAGNRGFDQIMTTDGGVLPSSGSLTGLALTQGGIVLSSDIGMDPRIEPRMRQLLLSRNIKAAAVIPLLHSSTPLGSINLLYKETPRLGESELKTLVTIGKTVSTALANSHLLEDLQHRAYHDSLTTLPNRLVLEEQFSPMVDAMDVQGSSIALLLLDLKHFKNINDTLGNQIGDDLLRLVAQRLKTQLSEHPGSRIFRMDGDEFLILWPEISGIESVLTLAESLLTALSKSFGVASLKLEITGNIGVAIAPRDGSDIRALLHCADIALSEAQRQECNVSIYNRTQDTYSLERQSLVEEIGTAISKKRFCLHYQPQLDLALNEVIGFEAFARWQHPRFGLLLPAAFLPLLEVTEAIHHLTHEVLRQGLEEQRRWRDRGKNYRLSINLSTRNLSNESHLEDLAKLLRQFDVGPDLLEFEITGNALACDPKEGEYCLSRISELGVRLAIDGYGAGHFSLALLRRLPINTLKIDPSFIQNMTKCEQDAVIVRSSIDMAHKLGLQVVAKGVENAASQSMLKEMGCDLVQGHHLCPPKAWREIERWLRD